MAILKGAIKRGLLAHATILVLGLQCFATTSVLAQDQPLPGVSQSPSLYLSGGAGTGERDAMMAKRNAYNLRLSFAEAVTGDLLADVSVSIEPANGGAQYGPFAHTGPLFYMRLSPGSYRVNANYQGSMMTRVILIGQQPVDEVLHWPKP